MTTQKTILFTFSPKGITKDYDYTYFQHHNDYFSKWHTVMDDFEINPELNQSGNLHYHGFYIVSEDPNMKFRWFSKILPKLKYNGMWHISEVKHSLSEAMIYPRKDREFMTKLMSARPIPLTKENYKLSTDKPTIKTLIDYIDYVN